MPKKNKFARKYRSLTDLGHVFNISAIAIGKKLKEAILRNDDGSPTTLSFDKEIAVSTPIKSGVPHYRWHFNRCREILVKNGLKPDHSFKIRKIIKSMLSIYKSEAMEMGGGIEYKYAIHEFFELVNRLPVATEFNSIHQVINEMKANKETKQYFFNVICFHLAERHCPSKEDITILLNQGSHSVLIALSQNAKVNEFTRIKAKQRDKEISTKRAEAETED